MSSASKAIDEVIEALNRFAKHTNESENVLAMEFKTFNKRRVDDFVNEPFNDHKLKQEQKLQQKASRRSNSHASTDIAGIFEYRAPEKYNRAISDAEIPEFSSAMGPRTRFGDGDGSFWDKWVGDGNEPPGPGLGFGKHRVPMRSGSHAPKMGFKRYYKSLGSELPTLGTVKSYAERKAERLERERLEKMSYQAELPPEPVGKALRDADWNSVALVKQKSLPPLTPADKPRKLISSSEESGSESEKEEQVEAAPAPPPMGEPMPSETAKLIPNLTFAEKEIYFGDRARAAFFDAYRHISRQQAILSGIAPGVRGVEILDKLGNTTFDEIIEKNLAKETEIHNRRKTNLRMKEPRHSTTAGSKAPLKGQRKGYRTDIDSSTRASIADDASEAEKLKALVHNHTVATKKANTMHTIVEERLGMSALRRCDSMMVQKEAQEAHLTRPPGGADAFLRPGSPRTRYLTGCLKYSVAPRPNLIIRKDMTSVINIEYQYIGDTMAIILANSLEGLPFVTELNVAGNKLTDVGLTALISALPSCPTINTVNFSENKIDYQAAKALSNYISSPGCNIVKLIMRRADIDDNEIESFVHAVERCKTMRYLDLGENRIGSNQSAGGTVNASKQSGGTVLASLLDNSLSKIDTLMVPWNTIRFEDGVRFTRSIRDNICLTRLDMSFNAIGEDGGMALGDALHTNKVLLYLSIANNSISPAAAFTIATGILSCRSLKEVDMKNNPIGEDGGRAIMMVSGLIGDCTKIDIGGCTLHGKESSSWFNILKPRVGRDKKLKEATEIDLDLTVPYDRAVCLQLLRVAATDEEFSRPKMKYIPVARVDGRGAQDIELFLHEEPIPDKENASFSWLSTEGIQIVTQVNTTPGAIDMIRMGFGMIDQKKTGHLGPWQMLRLVQQMGFKNSSDIEMLLKQLFILHAVSSASISGSTKSSAHSHAQDEVSCDEVIDFFKGIYKYCSDIRPVDSLIRFYHETEKAWKKEPYIPHDMGSMKLLLSYAPQRPSFCRTLSACNVANILETASKATDISKAIEFGLSHCKIQFQEAQTILKELLKDTGNKVKALTALLPKLATPYDVKWLQGFMLSFNSKEQHLIKTELGGLYKYLIGCLNGYYSLFLGQELDTLCLVNLIRRSISAQRLPENGDLVAANKNALIGFRNVLLDGHSTVITEAWLEKMPNIGHVEFDYVDLDNERSIFYSKPLTDWRFLQTIDGLELSCSKIEKLVESRLAKIRESIEREDEAVVSYTPPEGAMPPVEGAVDAAVRKESVTIDIRKAYWRLDDRSAEKAADYVVWLHQHQTQRESAKYVSKLDKATATGVFGVPGSKKGKYDDDLFQVLNEPFKFTESDQFGAHKAFAGCPKQSRVQLAGRLIDGITSDFGERMLSCAQLSVLILLLPFAALKKDSFSTFRVELIVRLFSNITDKHNFDRVVRILQPFEHAMLLYRIGALTMFSPLRPQGSYLLNLSDPEERLLARVLLQMQKEVLNPTLKVGYVNEDETVRLPPPPIDKNSKESEKPKIPGLWTDIGYQSAEDRAAHIIATTVPGNEWDMPQEWECEAGFPTSGALRFHYSAGPRLMSVTSLDKSKLEDGARVSVLDIISLPEVEIVEKR